MNDSNNWAIDRLAANTLFARLKMEVTADMVDAAAAQFAEHRRNSISWAAERAHSSMVQRLESASMTHGIERTDDWRSGFCHAEQQVMTMTPEDLLELGPDRPHQIGDRKARKRRRQRLRPRPEEHARKHGRKIEIEREIIPFDDGRKGRDHHRSA